MCRVTAWIGRPRTLEELIFGPAHGLAEQAYAPRLQDHGTLNADGFGAGWYVPGRAEPVRYRRAQPIWADASFASLAPTISTGCLLAAVRNASTGMPLDESATQPFTAGHWLFGHNGVVPDRAALAALLPNGTVAESAVDSAHLWALVHHRLGRGEKPAEALAATVGEVKKAAGGRLNLFLADGNRLAATAAGDTLFYRREPDGVTVASEPADDEPGWRRVPEGSVLSATDGEVEIQTLGGRL